MLIDLDALRVVKQRFKDNHDIGQMWVEAYEAAKAPARQELCTLCHSIFQRTSNSQIYCKVCTGSLEGVKLNMINEKARKAALDAYNNELGPDGAPRRILAALEAYEATKEPRKPDDERERLRPFIQEEIKAALEPDKEREQVKQELIQKFLDAERSEQPNEESIKNVTKGVIEHERYLLGGGCMCRYPDKLAYWIASSLSRFLRPTEREMTGADITEVASILGQHAKEYHEKCDGASTHIEDAKYALGFLLKQFKITRIEGGE